MAFKRGVTGHILTFEKKKVRGGCALPERDMQKPYVSKCGQGKTKIYCQRSTFLDYMDYIAVQLVQSAVVIDV
jgi:hypothetical protein